MTLNNRDLVKAELIWDEDHGTENEGWYLRTTWADGPSEDDVIQELQDAPRDESEVDLRSAAMLYLRDPDGMTDAAREELRGIIEIKR